MKFTVFILLMLLSGHLLFAQKNEEIGARLSLEKATKITDTASQWLMRGNPSDPTFLAASIGKNALSWRESGGASSIPFPPGFIRLIASKNGRFFGILSRRENQNDIHATLTLTVYAVDGKRLYDIQKTHFFDDLYPAIAISDRDGAVIFGQNSTAILQFYNPRGSLQKEIKLFSNAIYECERALIMDISGDGATIVVAAGERAASPVGADAPNLSGAPHLFVFDKNGNEQRRQALPGANTSNVSISTDGSRIAVTSYTISLRGELEKTTILFDQDQKEIARLPVLFKNAHFSADGRFLVLAENYRAIGVDANTGKQRWQFQLPRQQGMITALQTANDGAVTTMLIGKSEFRDGKFIFTQPRLKLLNSAGRLRHDLPIKYQNFEKPALKLSPDGSHIFIGFQNESQIYRLP